MAGYHARKEEKPKSKAKGKKVNYEYDPVSVATKIFIRKIQGVIKKRPDCQ